MLLIWLVNIVAVMIMSKRVELSLVDALYSTYHYQGPCTAIIHHIKNQTSILLLLCLPRVQPMFRKVLC